MNTDIRICISLPRHRKYKKLKRILACEPMLYLVIFWGTVAEQAPTGILSGWSESDVEDAAEWDGEPSVLFHGLRASGFLDVVDGGFCPHNWAEHQPWAIGAPERSEAARKAGKASAEARRNKAINKAT
ncbi:MAG: hypothetical protein A2Y38_23795 [Spirochaetes bacterium GWB1_59_5]|nr:MAG: hypothetical protein A2Y38_23795 [Spirochaetes bacterium GWB1_59_5]